MGLYDEEGQTDEVTNNEEIGRAIANSATKKKSKGSPVLDISNNTMTIILYCLGTILIVALFYGLFVMITPSPITYKINPNPSYLSDRTETTLRVEVRNNEDFILKNLVVSVKPTSPLQVAIIPSDKIEIPTLGPQEKRVLEYNMSLIGNAPEGDYTVDIRAESSQRTYTSQAKWSVKTHQ